MCLQRTKHALERMACTYLETGLIYIHRIITQNTKILLLKVVPLTENEVLLYWTTAVILSSAEWFQWSRGSMLVFGTQVHGFKPSRSRRIFQGEKILSTPFFGGEVKLFVPCRIFAACKRTRKCTHGSRSFQSKLPAISCPSSSSFHY